MIFVLNFDAFNRNTNELLNISTSYLDNYKSIDNRLKYVRIIMFLIY